MRGQWIFVLLCLSIAGKLVLGSLFPSTPSQDQPIQEGVTQTQEVKWPLPNLATIQVAVEEHKISSRDFYEAQVQEKKFESGQNTADISPQTIVVKTEEKSFTENITKNNEEVENKTLPLAD